MRERKPTNDRQGAQSEEPVGSPWFPTLEDEDDLEEPDSGGGESGQRIEISYPPPDEDVE